MRRFPLPPIFDTGNSEPLDSACLLIAWWRYYTRRASCA